MEVRGQHHGNVERPAVGVAGAARADDYRFRAQADGLVIRCHGLLLSPLPPSYNRQYGPGLESCQWPEAAVVCWDWLERRAGVMKLSRLAVCGGIAGPLLFTAAWVVSSLRQAGHPAAGVQLSGLAAEDARDPQIMIAAFVVLGACTIGFGAALSRVAAAQSAGPWLIMVAGAATVAVGVFRRDHMLLTGPGFGGESWHNQVHDVASGIAYAAMLAAPLVLARRFLADPNWAVAARPVLVLTLASAVTMAVFASQVAQAWNGLLQRAAVTLALTAGAAIAARLLTLPPADSGARPATVPSPARRSTSTR